MASETEETFTCPSCGETRPKAMAMPGKMIPTTLSKLIQDKHPHWHADQMTCIHCVNEAKADHMEDMLSHEHEMQSPAVARVIEQVREDELISIATWEEIEAKENPPDRFSMRMIGVIGHWRFSLAVLLLLAAWIIFNVATRPFEPYPVIVLAVISAVLASLAALQGPIILMAQRQQNERDRTRSMNDYLINLKAELEIRYLNEKVDQLLEEIVMREADDEA